MASERPADRNSTSVVEIAAAAYERTVDGESEALEFMLQKNGNKREAAEITEKISQ